jgi:hypothetical protein
VGLLLGFGLQNGLSKNWIKGFSKKLTDIGLLVLVFRILGLILFLDDLVFLDTDSGFSFSGYRTIDEYQSTSATNVLLTVIICNCKNALISVYGNYLVLGKTLIVAKENLPQSHSYNYEFRL